MYPWLLFLQIDNAELQLKPRSDKSELLCFDAQNVNIYIISAIISLSIQIRLIVQVVLRCKTITIVEKSKFVNQNLLQADLDLDDHRTSSEFPDLPHSPEHEAGFLESEPAKRLGVRRVDSTGGVAGLANPPENVGHHLKTTVRVT